MPLFLREEEDNMFLDKSADTIDSSDSYSWEVFKKEQRRRYNKYSKGTSTATTTSGSSGNVKHKKDSTQDAASFQVEVPTWFEDATEEISAFIKECRYADAA